MYEPRETDGTYSQIATSAFEQLKLGNVVFIKWTCPRCGERVTGTEPLELMMWEGRQVVKFPPGYDHTEKDDGTPCGQRVDITAHRFGLMLVMGTGDLSWLKKL